MFKQHISLANWSLNVSWLQFLLCPILKLREIILNEKITQVALQCMFGILEESKNLMTPYIETVGRVKNVLFHRKPKTKILYENVCSCQWYKPLKCVAPLYILQVLFFQTRLSPKNECFLTCMHTTLKRVFFWKPFCALCFKWH